MVMVKKSSGSREVESLDILAAVVRVLETNIQLEEREIELSNGQSFTADPNLSLKLQVEKNLVDPGVHEGVVFWDRFRLKKDESGEWTFAEYSKLGGLIVARYGSGWFNDPGAEFREEDFEDWLMACRIQPKTDPQGKKLKGSSIEWQSMRPAQAAPEVVAQAEQEETDDFSDIPF
jgi:hypothetical protein